MRNAEDVGVDDDAFCFSVGHAENDVGGFAGRAGDGDEFSEGAGDFAVEFPMMAWAAPLMDLALLRKKPVVRMRSSSSGIGALAMAAGVGKRLNNSGVTMLTRTSVHLRGEDGGDEQFPGGLVVQGADGVGVGFVEGFEDGGDAFGGEVAAGRVSLMTFWEKLSVAGMTNLPRLSFVVSQVSKSRPGAPRFVD